MISASHTPVAASHSRYEPLPAGYKLVSDVGSPSKITRLRKAGLLPAPLIVNGRRCYSDAQLAECERLFRLGEDEWMKTNHGRGRPSVLDVGRLGREAAC